MYAEDLHSLCCSCSSKAYFMSTANRLHIVAAESWNRHVRYLINFEIGHHLADVQFLGELVENRAVAVLVLLDDGNYESDQFMPKVYAIQSWTVILGVSLGLVRITLEFSVVQLVRVLEQELICGSQAGLDAVFDHGTGSRRTRQLLDFHPEEGDAGQEVDRRLQVHQLVGARRRKVVPVHRQVYAQGVVQLIQQLDEFLFLRIESWSVVIAGRRCLTPKLEAAKRSLAETADSAVVCA